MFDIDNGVYIVSDGLSCLQMPVFNVEQRTFRYINFSGEGPPSIRYPCSVQFENCEFFVVAHFTRSSLT